MTKPIPVWLDCDPGHDDAFAILLAAYHPGIKLLGISTTFGNSTLENTTWNTTCLLTAFSLSDSIPVYVGAAKPLVRPSPATAASIHGTSGIDGTQLLPQPQQGPRTNQSFTEAATIALLAEPAGTAWIVSTGPLTNVALLLRAEPRLAAHLAGVSAMGGAVGGGFSVASTGPAGTVGNWTPWAEFNIFVDPEAAAEVFENPELRRPTADPGRTKLILVPLDVTHQALATKEVQASLLFGRPSNTAAPSTLNDQETSHWDLAREAWLAATPASPGELGLVSEQAEQSGWSAPQLAGRTRMRTMLVELLTFFAKTYLEVFGLTEGPPLHDPLAVAAVLAGTEWEIPFYYTREASAAHHSDGEGEAAAERFDVRVVTEDGPELGRTIVTALPVGEGGGVRVSRGLDAAKFWQVIEDCVERADAANLKAGNIL